MGRFKGSDPLLSKTEINLRLLASDQLKSIVTDSGCESRSPGPADAVQDPPLARVIWPRVGTISRFRSSLFEIGQALGLHYSNLSWIVNRQDSDNARNKT